MSKIKITLKQDYVIGGDTLSGEIELEAPTMGTMVDAGTLCPPSNPIGFGLAIVAVTLKVPMNQLKQMSPEDFMSLQEDLKDILPN